METQQDSAKSPSRKRILFVRASNEAPRTIVVRMTNEYADSHGIKHGPEVRTVESSPAGVFEILPSDQFYDLKVEGLRKACRERADIVEIPEGGSKNVVPHPLNPRLAEKEKKEMSAVERASFTEVIASQEQKIRLLLEENERLKAGKGKGEK